jgi:hypothetical protein
MRWRWRSLADGADGLSVGHQSKGKPKRPLVDLGRRLAVSRDDYRT